MAIQINVTIKGATQQFKALPYSSIPKVGAVKGGVAGTLNGKPYNFIVTKGQGRGTVMQYCAYFILDTRVYYFYTVGALLDAGAAVQVIDQPAAAAPAATPAPAAPAKPAPKAPAKGRAKGAKAPVKA